MHLAQNSDNQQPTVWAMGPVPPPVTGMTLLTQAVLQQLQQAGPVKFHNWSHGRQQVTAAAHALRVWRTMACLLKLITAGRVENQRLYLVCNSRSGLLLTVALVFAARLLGHRVYLHHHTYGYIDQYNRWMSWIDRRMDSHCAHVVHCEQMMNDFRRQYPTKCHFETVFPSVVSLTLQQPRNGLSSPLALGILSNLTIPKGTGLAIDVFRALHDRGRDVRLKLAGPITSDEAQSRVAQTLAEFPNQVCHLGPVYADSKLSFFRNIDVLLFPTRYREESWGIVLNEALAAGVPVITFDRGCTRTVVGDRAGLVVARDGDFVAAATRQIEHWMDHPGDYQDASHAAVEQADYLHRQGQSQLDVFARRMFAPLDAS
jgi:glycosyltransferase involved in cell wall biosynthesis